MTDRTVVPLNAVDPIDSLLDQGSTVPELAVAWRFKTVDSVYRLKRYDYVPPATTAKLMAETFGPEWTAGDVINHWLARVEQKQAAL